ncbi:hypothetical protein CZ771_10460 [Actinomycetales bacterium JB111]|nr:hypothetical protein CZ771_10460 [Actinomycetales bacterium JB111]
MAGGRWQVAGGRWQVAGGRWQVAHRSTTRHTSIRTRHRCRRQDSRCAFRPPARVRIFGGTSFLGDVFYGRVLSGRVVAWSGCSWCGPVSARAASARRIAAVPCGCFLLEHRVWHVRSAAESLADGRDRVRGQWRGWCRGAGGQDASRGPVDVPGGGGDSEATVTGRTAGAADILRAVGTSACVSSARGGVSSVGPSGVLFGVVATFAEPAGVGLAGRAAVGVGCGVVDVPDGGVAVRAGTDVIAQEDELAELSGELPGPALRGHEAACCGVGPQPTVEHPSGLGHVVAGDRGREGTVSGEPGRPVTAAGQGLVGHHDRQGHIPPTAGRRVARGGGGRVGESPEEEIGADLVPRPPVGLPGVDQRHGLGVEGGEGADGLDHGHVRGQVGHVSRCGTDGDPALLDLGFCPPEGVGLVQLQGERPRAGSNLPIPQQWQIPREGFVDSGTVHRRQARGLLHHEGGSPLTDPSGGQVTQCPRHLPHQRLRHPEVPRATGGGIHPGQGDLRTQTPTSLTKRHTPAGLLVLTVGRQLVGGDGLRGRRRRLELLQGTDLLDRLRLRRRRHHGEAFPHHHQLPHRDRRRHHRVRRGSRRRVRRGSGRGNARGSWRGLRRG